MRILVVEDDQKIASALKKGLQLETYAVDIALDGEQGLDLALSESYDIIILDRMLPLKDGETIAKELRAEKNHTPILMLTAKGQVHERVEGLDAGADDYLIKPFAFDELLARIRALSRRPKKSLSNVLKIEDLTLDKTAVRVERKGKHIVLSAKEFALLEFLLRNQGKPIAKDVIIEHVWSYDADILPNTLEVFIGSLRKKIDKPFSTNPLIHTVRGFGYKLESKDVYRR